MAKGAIFLERKSYRQRRLRDVARMLPLLGIFLWLLPLGWRGSDNATAGTLVFIFAVWLVLIILTAIVSSRIKPDPEAEQDAS